jgi:hypothetical protein
MLEPRSSLHTATVGAVQRRVQPAARPAFPRRALAVAALLSLLFGYLLSQLLGARHPSITAVAGHRPAGPQHGLSSLPLAVQGPVSAALGADDRAYHIWASRGGFQAINPSQRFNESFDSSGVVVATGEVRVALSLRAVGYGNALAALPARPPRATANRVTYTYPGLTEWYDNGPLGLEQGFTIRRVRAGRANAPLTLSLALAGDAHVSLGSGGQVLRLSLPRGRSLRYGGLRVSDARGHVLRSWLELRTGTVLLRTDARGARYPLRIDPFIQQGEKLVGTGQSGSGAPRLGYSAALSSDGNTALVGGPGDYGETGAAWVFKRSGETWTQQGSKLTGSGEVGEAKFGSSVALDSKGETALIGGPSDNGATGAAWVFTRSGETWTQQGSKLTGGGEVGASTFGTSVTLSSTGNTALIGGPGDVVEQEAEVTGGSKVVKGLSSTAVIEVGTVVSGEKIEAGTTVAKVISSKEVELSTAVEGSGTSKEKLTFATRVGAAWVFTRSAGTWSQQEKLAVASGEVGGGELGKSVAVSADGNTALIGGPGDNEGAGAAWVFTFSSTEKKWIQQAKLAEPLNAKKEKEEISSQALPGELGASVALASSPSTGAANTALLGAPGDNKGVGAAWAYTGSGSTWTQQGAKLTGSGEITEEPGEGKFPGRFGSSVALSAAESATAASTALIGGPGDNKAVGAAWAFTRSAGVWSQQGGKLTAGGEVGSGNVGASSALSSDGTTGLIGGSVDNSAAGAAWVFTRSGEAWTQQGSKLTGSGASARSPGQQGLSVALSSDGNTALVGGPEDGPGAARVFTRSGSTWTQQGSKLTGAEERSTHAGFGSTVALSSDGNTALIGGPGDAAVVEREGEVTEKATTVKGLASTTGIFEGSVVSGSKIASGAFVSKLIGAHEVELSAAVEGTGSATVKENLTFTSGGTGAAWVFTRSGEMWTQQGPKLTGAGVSSPPSFGSSVALSSDGNTALIGGPTDKNGAAWAFTRSAGVWTQQGERLTGGGASGFAIDFGASVALSGEGSTALVGGPSDNSLTGAAWVFTRSGSIWTQQGSKLTGSEGSGSPEFGLSVTLSATGNTAWIGGPGDNTEVGAAWAFTRSGSTWTQQGSKLTGTGASGKALFGSSVALSSEGNTALVGGPGDSSKAGAEWAFTRSGSTWTQQGSKLTGSGASGLTGRFGASVALSSEGNTALIGGPGDYNNTGAAWVFFQNLPIAVTEPASSVAQTTATLNGKVNPDGSGVSECKFEYGTMETYGSSASCTPPPGSGTSPVAVSASVSGLVHLTTYHFRISAKNAVGESKGQDQTFRTPPETPTLTFSLSEGNTTWKWTLNEPQNTLEPENMRTLLRFSTEPPNQIRGIFKYPVQSWFAGSLEPKCAQVRAVKIFPGPLPNEESAWSPLVCDPPAPAPHITHTAPMQDPTAIGHWVERIQADGKRVWFKLQRHERRVDAARRPR